MASNQNSVPGDLNLGGREHKTESYALVAIGGKLPICFQVTTTKLLDIIIALSPKSQRLNIKQRKAFRQQINNKLYNKTRPGFYWEAAESFHIAYAGQLAGAKTQHHWRIFCDDSINTQIESLIAGTTLTTSTPNAESNGNYTKEWGGLYLRSEAEVRIAEALDFAGVLFFANSRGRVGLQDTAISDAQLTGRVEVDFLIFHQGKCVSLEVDGQHHLADDQCIRDYAHSNLKGKDKELVVVDLTVGDRYRVPEKAEWFDLRTSYILRPGRCVLIKTQEKIQIPNNIFAYIVSRGGLSGKGLVVSNTKIDPLFIGYLHIPVFNGGKQSIKLERGASFCSVVFHLLEQPVPSDGPRDPVDPETTPQVYSIDTFHEYFPLLVTGILSALVTVIGTYLTIRYTPLPQPSQTQPSQVQPPQTQPSN